MSNNSVLIFATIVGCAFALAAEGTVPIYGQRYKHKSEAEIARITPAERVDEYAEEQIHHKYDVLDEQSELIEKYIWRDGLKALPRTIEIMDSYDVKHRSGREADRFDAMWMLLSDLDNHVVRLRGSSEGNRAMDALNRAIQRMRSAGYERKGQHEYRWVPDGRFEMAVIHLQALNGINNTDEAIRNTLGLERGTKLSSDELLEFSNFLVARYRDYPSWSEKDFVHAFDQSGKPMPGLIVKKLQPFYEAYLEFKKAKR